MSSYVLVDEERAPAEPDTRRPALLAGEEGETPDQCIFRGID
ncbi:hypothetical protein [Streptomyces sp. Ru72]|nr:hypothetical protein [Streptomyces sp. Ru72]